MTQITEAGLRGLAGDVQTEVAHLRRLADDIAAVHAEIAQNPAHARLFYENLALKLHNSTPAVSASFRWSSPS